MSPEVIPAAQAAVTKPEPSPVQAKQTEAPRQALKPAMQAPRPQPQVMEQTLKAVAAQIDSYLKSVGRQLEFRVDTSSGRTVVAVRDAAGELIRQIPSEEALRIGSALGSGAAALLDTAV